MMNFVAGDDTGLIKVSESVREKNEGDGKDWGRSRIRIFKSQKQNRRERVTCVTWSGGLWGLDESEFTAGRSSGRVDAYERLQQLPKSLVTNSHKVSALGSVVLPLRSCRIPSPVVYVSMMGPSVTHEYLTKFVCNELLGDGSFAFSSSLKEKLLQPPVRTLRPPVCIPKSTAANGKTLDGYGTNVRRRSNRNEEVIQGNYHSDDTTFENYTHDSFNTHVNRTLIVVGSKGHACVFNWGDATLPLEGVNDDETTIEDEDVDVPPPLPLYVHSVDFKRIHTDTQASYVSFPPWADSTESLAVYSATASPSIVSSSSLNVSTSSGVNCLGAYLLPSPISAAAHNCWLTNLIGFGGEENNVKAYDVHTESIIWSAKNIKKTVLNLRTPVSVSALSWLGALHPLIIAATSSLGSIRIFDLRCQKRPIFELPAATHEKRPITTIISHPPQVAMHQNKPVPLLVHEAAVASMQWKTRWDNGENLELGIGHTEVERSAERAYSLVKTTNVRSKTVNKGASTGSKRVNTTVSELLVPKSGKTAWDCKVGTMKLDRGRSLLFKMTGRSTVRIYYGDTYGMVYGEQLFAGDKIFELSDPNVPKYNNTSYRCEADEIDDGGNGGDTKGEIKPRAKPNKDVRISMKRRYENIQRILEEKKGKLLSIKNDARICWNSVLKAQIFSKPVGAFRGIMGAILGLSISPDGGHLVAVGLGRFAYIFETKRRKVVAQIFLKQKLMCCIAGGSRFESRINGTSEHMEKSGRVAGRSSGNGHLMRCVRNDEVADMESVSDESGPESPESDDAPRGFQEELDECGEECGGNDEPRKNENDCWTDSRSSSVSGSSTGEDEHPEYHVPNTGASSLNRSSRNGWYRANRLHTADERGDVKEKLFIGCRRRSQYENQKVSGEKEKRFRGE